MESKSGIVNYSKFRRILLKHPSQRNKSELTFLMVSTKSLRSPAGTKSMIIIRNSGFWKVYLPRQQRVVVRAQGQPCGVR